mgnify:CR=1 FL=1
MELHGIKMACLGDSITEGVGTSSKENVYWNVLKKKLNQFRSYVPVNMINVSIGGTTAAASVGRLEKQKNYHLSQKMIIQMKIGKPGTESFPRYDHCVLRSE